MRIESAEVGREDGFHVFYLRVEPLLRRALVAVYGAERGTEATAEALTWAWEHTDVVMDLEHPVAYLYRVGQSRSRRRKLRVLHARPTWADPWVEPALADSLRRLSERQRMAVILIHGHAWTSAEVAALLGCETSTVQTHLERGLARLRADLKVSPDE